MTDGFRISTDFRDGVFYQAVRGLDGLTYVVASDREVFEAEYSEFCDRGLVPADVYVREVKGRIGLDLPRTLCRWSPASLEGFASGGLIPLTFRDHFEKVRRFVSRFVFLPDPCLLDLASVLVLVSYWVAIWPAVPIVEVRGEIGSGKTTLFSVLSSICRSGLFASHITEAALARARSLDPTTLFIDEPFFNPDHPLLKGSYKNGSHRIVCGNREPDSQSLYGMTFKIADSASKAIKDRSITIEMLEAGKVLPSFRLGSESKRVQSLIDHSLLLSLWLFESVLSEYERFLSKQARSTRSVEKWAPVIATARVVDASDRDKEPIAPRLESLMNAQTSRERLERAATDPALLVIAATQDFVSKETGDVVEVPASDLTEFVSEFTAQHFSIQRVGELLKDHGIVMRSRRTRNVKTRSQASKPRHPVTVYELDLSRLSDAVKKYGIEEEL